MNDLPMPDRATPAAWNRVNVAGWTLLAAFLALDLHSLVALAGWRHIVFAQPGAETPVLIVAQLAIRGAIAGALGIGIGILVGSKVGREQAFWAGVAASAYVLIVAVVYEQSSGAEGVALLADTAEIQWRRATSMALAVVWEMIAAVTVPLAAWCAEPTAQRRRPVAGTGTA